MTTITLRVALASAVGLGLGLGMPAKQTVAAGYTYHGSLQDAGKAANGSYDMKLTLYSAQTGGSLIAGPVTLRGVEVSDGNFVSDVDFGPLAMLNQAGWIAVEVKAAGGQFVALDKRSSVAAPEAACPGSWTLDGNSGNPVGSYLGTADSKMLELKAGGLSAATFTPISGENPMFATFGSVGLANPDNVHGQNSIAAGYHGDTEHDDSFDFSPQGGIIQQIPTTAPMQFIVNAPNGFGINTATAPNSGPLREELTVSTSPNLPGTDADLTLLTPHTSVNGHDGFSFSATASGVLHINGINTASPSATTTYDQLLSINHIASQHYAQFSFNGAPFQAGEALSFGTNASSGNGAFLSSTGIWTNASSRNFKEAFTSIDPVKVLEKLVAMPVKTWFYKGAHDDGLHMGPVAEDFASTFGLGSNEKYIGSVDESGVAFAAIQGLNHKLEAKIRQMETGNAALIQQNGRLQSALDAVVARLDKLESRRGE